MIQTLRPFRHWMLSVLPIYIHPEIQSWQHGFSRMSVVVALNDHLRLDLRCQEMLLDRLRALLLRAQQCIIHDTLHPGSHPLCPRDHVHTLDRMALARSSRRAPPSHHLHKKRSLLRFEVHGCREFGLVLR